MGPLIRPFASLRSLRPTFSAGAGENGLEFGQFSKLLSLEAFKPGPL